MPDASPLQPIYSETAADLIIRQFPEFVGLEICPQPSLGTDNTIIRIGSDLCARFPRVAWATGTARREAGALPRFAGAPLPVPQVYGIGTPSEIYPHNWSVLSWLPGFPLEDSAISDSQEAAKQLSGFFLLPA